MFEPISESLSQLAGFAVIGFFLAVAYEPLRIIRLFHRQGDFFVCLQDFLFLTFAGFVTFIYSMELGGGSFRLFYAVGELFGAAVYFLTVGRLVSMLSDRIVRGVKWVLRKIDSLLVKPVCRTVVKIYKWIQKKLVKLYNLTGTHAQKSARYLKKSAGVLYNKHKPHFSRNPARPHKTANINVNTKEKRNVIKAEIRKKA